MQPNPEATQALAQIRGVYEDKFAEINGRRYDYHPMRHLDRRAVFAFMSTVQGSLGTGDFGFLATEAYARVEPIMARACSCDGLILDKAGDWWDQHPEDYLIWVATSLQVISFPFFPGALTGSAAAAPSPTAAPRLRKPMLGLE